MNTTERLKIAVRTSSTFIVGIGAIILTAATASPADTAPQPIDMAVETSETTTSYVTTLATTNKAITSASTTPHMTTSVTTETTETPEDTASETTTAALSETTDIPEPVVEVTQDLQTEPVEIMELPTETETTAVSTEFDVADTTAEEQQEIIASAGQLIRSGMRGTFYAPGRWNGYSNRGGSGRSLLDCRYGSDGYAKGSIASGYLYRTLGYKANGGRTAVWLEVHGYPDMSGVYYLDDCSGADVIDFFYDRNRNCQFSRAGVVSVDVYYVN